MMKNLSLVLLLLITLQSYSQQERTPAYNLDSIVSSLQYELPDNWLVIKRSDGFEVVLSTTNVSTITKHLSLEFGDRCSDPQSYMSLGSFMDDDWEEFIQNIKCSPNYYPPELEQEVVDFIYAHYVDSVYVEYLSFLSTMNLAIRGVGPGRRYSSKGLGKYYRSIRNIMTDKGINVREYNNDELKNLASKMQDKKLQQLVEKIDKEEKKVYLEKARKKKNAVCGKRYFFDVKWSEAKIEKAKIHNDSVKNQMLKDIKECCVSNGYKRGFCCNAIELDTTAKSIHWNYSNPLGKKQLEEELSKEYNFIKIPGTCVFKGKNIYYSYHLNSVKKIYFENGDKTGEWRMIEKYINLLLTP